MSFRLKTILAGALALAFFVGVSVSAHRAKAALTIAEYNADTRNFEVTHQLHLHDAQFALNRIVGNPQASIFDLEQQAELLLHLGEQFEMRSAQHDIKLNPLGAEIDGDHLYLFYESAPLEPPKTIRVRHDLLRDIFPDQINQINVTIGPVLRTLILNEEDKVKTTLF